MISEALILDQQLKETEFMELCSEVQEYISEKCPQLITNTSDMKEQMKNTIKKYLLDNKKSVKDMNLETVIEKIYCEMSELSILTPLLDTECTDIEEININAWNDIKINYSDGRVESLNEHFYSPIHCYDVIKRLLKQESSMIFDLSHPIQRGHLKNKIRITVMGEGVIDKAVGVAVSMRIINPKNLERKDFIEKGTATGDMLNTLRSFHRHGVSMCITGETNSGKTTLMTWILSNIQKEKRVFSIEEDVREFDLTKYDAEGRVINNVVHTKTKKSDDSKKTIDQDKLLETSLTMNPDVLCVSEMKDKEAYAAQEAARTGHTVITTTHAKSCRATYNRMVTLCKKAVDLDGDTLRELVEDAFPIVCYIKRDEDKVRRIKEITECIVDEETGKSKIVTLYKFMIKENVEDESGKIVHIDGEFVKVNNISDSLKKFLIDNGISSRTLKRLFESPCVEGDRL